MSVRSWPACWQRSATASGFDGLCGLRVADPGAGEVHCAYRPGPRFGRIPRTPADRRRRAADRAQSGRPFRSVRSGCAGKHNPGRARQHARHRDRRQRTPHGSVQRRRQAGTGHGTLRPAQHGWHAHRLLPDTNETHWRVLSPRGQHAVAVGIQAPVLVEIDGTVGYYCAGMNKEATVVVNGNRPARASPKI